MELPPNASLFTYDTVAMYPSINTTQCILRLSEYFSSPEITSKYGFSSKVLIKVLTLVMLNNCMQFGDIIVKQLSGIAMDMLLAPTIANLFVAIYETTHVLPCIPQIVLSLCRFIDDDIGVWLHDPDPLVDKSNWHNFQACLNDSGLKWIFSEQQTEVVFMDLRLKIDAKKVVASLYAKPMALHLYIPPHSYHAPGVLPGIIFGNVLQIHQLCSGAADVTRELKIFFHRLLDPGYQLAQLTPLFQQAMDNVKAYLWRTALDHLRAWSKKRNGQHRRVFLHLPYHPTNPSLTAIQKLWHDCVASPKGQPPLYCLTNNQGYNIPIERLTIAWHCPPNLGNLLSYRKLNKRMGLKVLFYIKT
jgi:hypothetical protein